MSKFATIIKDSFAWQADFIEDHPWVCVALIWVLGIVAVAF
jgi:hypothetical protein